MAGKGSIEAGQHKANGFLENSFAYSAAENFLINLSEMRCKVFHFKMENNFPFGLMQHELLKAMNRMLLLMIFPAN